MENLLPRLEQEKEVRELDLNGPALGLGFRLHSLEPFCFERWEWVRFQRPLCTVHVKRKEPLPSAGLAVRPTALLPPCNETQWQVGWRNAVNTKMPPGFPEASKGWVVGGGERGSLSKHQVQIAWTCPKDFGHRMGDRSTIYTHNLWI